MHCTAARMVQSYLIAFSENGAMARGIYVKSSPLEWISRSRVAFLLYRQQTLRQPHASLALERKSKWMHSFGRAREVNLSVSSPQAAWRSFTGQPEARLTALSL